MARHTPLTLATAALALSGAGLGAAAQAVPDEPPCRSEVVRGRVAAGQGFEAPLGHDLVLRLVPERHSRTPPGWTVRVTPPAMPEADYAMVATPPYRFWNPRYLDTSYGVDAERALATTPRAFAFVASDDDYQAARRALAVLLWPDAQTDRAVDAAARILDEVPTYAAQLFVEDGRVAPDPDHPGGRITWLAFRVEACVPEE